jgi:hypothetical protein
VIGHLISDMVFLMWLQPSMSVDVTVSSAVAAVAGVRPALVSTWRLPGNCSVLARAYLICRFTCYFVCGSSCICLSMYSVVWCGRTTGNRTCEYYKCYQSTAVEYKQLVVGVESPCITEIGEHDDVFCTFVVLNCRCTVSTGTAASPRTSPAMTLVEPLAGFIGINNCLPTLTSLCDVYN